MWYLLLIGTPLLLSAAAPSAGPSADEWLDQSQWETMPPEVEAQFIREWDASLSKGLATGPGGMLGRVLEVGDRYAPRFMRLRYNNDAIQQRVVNLYIAECQYQLRRDIAAGEGELQQNTISTERREFIESHLDQFKAQLARSLKRDGDLLVGVPMADPGREGGELELDYHDQLGAVAVSTCSPRLYENVWEFPLGYNEAFPEYFARVNCEETLRHLFHATLGERFGKRFPGVCDRFCRVDTGAAMSVNDAFDTIRRISIRDGRLVVQYHSQVLQLMERCRYMYWHPEDEEFNRRKCIFDYRMRKAMLLILQEIGTEKDIPFAKSLAVDIIPYDYVIDTTILERSDENPPIDELSIRVVEKIARGGS